MFNDTPFSQDISHWQIPALRNAIYMINNTSQISTYRVNNILGNWSTQRVKGNVDFRIWKQYGGCETNYQEGVDGFARLQDKGRNMAYWSFISCPLK
jgi:hypothetical protein